MKRPPADKPELLRWLQMQGDADRRILAQLWTLPPDSDAAALYRALTEPDRVVAQWSRLSDVERAAMTRVLQDGGALPAAILQREWGTVRDSARFSNPRAYLQALEQPASPAERLYTMGLLVRDHDDRGPLFRVLNDLRRLLPAVEPRDACLRVIPAPEPDAPELAAPEAAERTVIALLELAYEVSLKTLDDGALNKASLVRLAARVAPGSNLSGIRREADWPWVALLRASAAEAGLLRRTTDGTLHVAGPAMAWLKGSRAERLAALVRGWVGAGFNELTLLGGLSLRSLPLDLRLPESRQSLLHLLASLPAGPWLRLDEIVSEVERVEPDFLRRNGRYDSWLLYDASGKLVAGRESWPLVEGVFVRAAILAVLRWFGLVDVAGAGQLDIISFNPLAAHIIQGAPPPPEQPSEPLTVQGTFEIVCPPGASLWAHFQLQRIAELVGDNAAAVFRLTRRSVLAAAEHGIGAEDILRFLTENARGPVPQGVAAYVHEWSRQVGQLQVEEMVLLRADDPLRLLEVRRSRGVDLSLVEELTPTAWKVSPGDLPALLQQLQRAGFSITGSQEPAGRVHGSDKAALSEYDLKALVTAAYAYAHICSDLGLPSEVSASMLMRLRKLVPSRHAEAARRAAEELSCRVLARKQGETVRPDADRADLAERDHCA